MNHFIALKHPLKHWFILFLLLCPFFNVHAQNQPYELLWKISGKDLKKPSYLFGSIHVRDRKVFNFSDSVMKSIAKSTAFVLELHPDSMLTHLYDERKSENLKAVLDDEQKDIVAKKYEDKYGIAPDQNQLNNALFVRDVMRPDLENDDDMFTFLDAYLYGIAKTQGKKIFGLEEPADQLDGYLNNPDKINQLFDLDEDQSKSEFNKLVDLYISGNLKDIDSYTNTYVDDSLNKRNLVMLNGILELLKKETLFVCVGVAHLPGQNGLIELLRKQGYKVTLEPASFTGTAKKYTIDPKKFAWYEYETPEYKISFPSMPFTARKTIELRMMHLPDLMSGISFGVVSVYTPQKTDGIVLDSVAQFIANKAKVVISNKKHLIKNGIKMMEVEMIKEGKKSISRIFYQHNYFYTLAVDNIHKETDPAYIDLFFNSFNAKKPVTATSKWTTNKYDASAFTVRTPVEPQIQEINSKNPNTNQNTVVSMYMAPDLNRNVNYIYRANDFPEGFYMADKAAVFNGAITQASKRGETVGEPKIIFKDGFEGRAIDVIVSNTYMELQIFLRGNRQYMLARQNLSGPVKPADDEFFDSFQFLPYQQTATTTFSIKNITSTWPEKPEAAKENIEQEDKETHFLTIDHTYQRTNKNTGGLYIIEYSDISKYYRNTSLDSLYNIFGEQLRSNLSDLTEKEFTIGNITGREIVGIDTLSGNTKKSRIWLQDENIILQQLASTKDEVESTYGKAFFNETKTTGKPFHFNLQASKAALIIKDLKSIDTNTQKYAKGALAYYKFDKEELPLLYQGIKHSYTDDTTSTGVKATLINSIKFLKDKNAVPLLKTTFYDPKNGDELRAKILADIPQLDSTQYDWYLNELRKSNLILKNQWELFKPLSDSLAYVAKHFEPFLALFDKQAYRRNALSIVAEMLAADSITTYKPLLLKNIKPITQHALTDLNEDFNLLKSDLYPNTAYQYLNILPTVDKALADEFTAKIMNFETSDYLKTRAVEVRIKNNLVIPDTVLTAQLDSMYSRFAILSAYQQIGQLDKIPIKYLEPSEFGRLLVYDYAIEDYEIENLIHVGEVELGNEIYHVYSFEITEQEEKTKCIGIAGAFQKNSKKLDFDSQFGYSNFDKIATDWKKQAKVLIEQFKEN